MKSSLGLLRARSASSRSKLPLSSLSSLRASSTSVHDSLGLLTPEEDDGGGADDEAAAGATAAAVEAADDDDENDAVVVAGAVVVEREVVVGVVVVAVARVANEAGDVRLLGAAADDRLLTATLVLGGMTA